ncbi:hypothetical protein LOD99_830 [Oopsacas minuta]|uniref:HTH psq-type domain-containing protein n=1 Tax=Oopsacas minuta TaxID=111878 RepID=A0AAV7JZP7_9METZ|nr:hypothetical protein LOD99_830 [Oopsacas minuta]
MTSWEVMREGKTTEKKGESGRTAQKLPVLKRRRLKQVANNKKGVSHRKLAAKFNVSRSYVGKVLRSQNVKYFLRQKCPVQLQNNNTTDKVPQVHESETLSAKFRCSDHFGRRVVFPSQT